MKVTKFEGIGRDLIKVYFDKKYILITGELTMTPIFYANISSIVKWESPYEKETIDENVKKEIIESIQNYTKDSKVKVVFD